MTRPILYHTPQTRAGTTLWMNEELGNVCDIELIDTKADAQKSGEYLIINPMGKVPALIHESQAVTEVAAICAYLADRFPEKNLAPPLDGPLRGLYYRWMFFAPSCIEPGMLDFFTGKERENPGSAGHGTYSDTVKTIEQALINQPWLLGDQFSAADVVFGSTLNFATMFGALEKRSPFTDYLARISARPAFERAQEKNIAYAKELGWDG